MSRICIIIILSFHFLYSGIFAQPSLSFDLKKPPKFENKTLGSEKTGNKKFTVPRRFIQNTITHYNYYYNAKNRLNEVIARAKAAHRDDYTQLLPFYNYSLQATANYKTDLDSVIYKSTAGVLIHDLRNDWIDNLYLLIGKAYYLRNDMDSAYLTFQYVNFAFSPKEKDGYDKVIGSNQDAGSNAFSISTKEKTNIAKKIFGHPPSRNESLVWQVKIYLAKDELAEAAGLMETLKNDPYFPDRLKSELEEVQALWFYKQQVYDSAAAHLEKTIDNAENKQEQARWEYLIAQLYERMGKHDLAEKFYEKAIRHTIDPVLEVYARLNSIRQNKNGNEENIQKAIDELVKMAKKDRYLLYRDIIYYTAAIVELERNNPDAAKALLLRSIKTNINNAAQKNRSFLALGDLSFEQNQYTAAKNFYDSVDIRSILPSDTKFFNNRKAALDKIVSQTSILERQDSLNRVAALPEPEREAFINKLLKQLRKQQGFKEDETGIASNNSINTNNPAATDLFGGSAAKGDWYFYNAALKGKGFSEFRIKWGNRPNADNWRRQAAIAQPSYAQGQSSTSDLLKDRNMNFGTPVVLTFEALFDNLPLTPEKQKISNDSSEHALFYLGKAYMDGLEEYPLAINAFEKLLTGFPATIHAEEAMFNLYYCYIKAGNPAGQSHIKQALASKFATGKYYALLNSPNMAQSPDSIYKAKATKLYENIYNLFIEGNFKEALSQKKMADSIYGQNFWMPQLLYIEGVYYIRQREDSMAKRVLGKIIQLYPSSPMQLKTANLLAVLNRRKEIEEYLTKLDIEKPEDNASILKNTVQPQIQISISPGDNQPKKVEPIVIPKESQAKKVEDINMVKEDQPKKEEAQLVPIEITKKETNPSIVKTDIATIIKPSVENKLPVRNSDSLQLIKKRNIANADYSDNPAEAHYVVLVLDKVDPVYATEARNAFNRYHRERYSDKIIEITSFSLDEEKKLILLKNFEDAAAALDYIEKTKKLTQIDIIPWLTASKYSFLMIAESNLEILKNKKDIISYKKFLAELYPGLF